MMKNLVLFLFPLLLFSQNQYVYINFKDKPSAAVYLSNPNSMLSQKAIDRRNIFSIPIIEQDVPIENTYIQQIKNLGITIISKSKWLNAVGVEISATQKNQVLALPFVKNISSFVKDGTQWKTATIVKNNKFSETASFDYRQAFDQITQINLKPLHDAGYSGLGVDIAVFDTGFPNVNSGSFFQRVRDNNLIKGVYNLISDNSDVYNPSLNNHGTLTLSTMSAFSTNTFAGTAPDSNYWLFVTESGPFEIPQEESWWIEAAEKADSIGVNIISSSLGYLNVFDDARYNYTTNQMDGQTSFIAKGAKIATEKGIMVVNAAGNEGTSSWQKIITPADVESVLTVGAVNSTGSSASFSSYGPTSDNRIKPDISSQGQASATSGGNSVQFFNGTSFSCPIIAGGVASLMQAFPNVPPATIKTKLIQSADLYPNITNQKGYGIPDFWKVYQNLKIEEQNQEIFSIYPNPTSKYIHLKTNKKEFIISMYESSGKLIKQISNTTVIDIENFNAGIYLLSINCEGSIKSFQIIKR